MLESEIAPHKKRVFLPPALSGSSYLLLATCLHNNLRLWFHLFAFVRRLSFALGRAEEDLPVHVLARPTIDTVDDSRNVGWCDLLTALLLGRILLESDTKVSCDSMCRPCVAMNPELLVVFAVALVHLLVYRESP